MNQIQTSSRKNAPQRTCVACREVKDKRELIRLVRLADGSVAVDVRGRMMGRGAYLCSKAECWQTGLSGNRLEYVLKTSIATADRERLLAEAQSLIGGS